MLKQATYVPFTTKEIKPSGWLKRQLEIQADGLSGHLDEIWPDIRDSKWIGGTAEGWERVPYWLDGFIPLAFLLDREDLKVRAKKYIDAILSRQQEDGWICPCSEEERERYDVWATYLICKVLVLYEECSGDERIEDAVSKALRNLNLHLERHTAFNWAAARWYECLIPIYWLYQRKPETWLLDLAFKLQSQGFNYKKLFTHWRFQEPDEHGRWSYMTHVVNLAMALKAECLMARLTGADENQFTKEAIELLQRDHGMATGHFTGDECLSGNSPIQGSELCSVVEAMYSYEHLLALTGDTYWGDLLERLAFNAFPATTSPDMWTHQYDQMSNQVECSYLPDDHVIFRTNNGESHLFGLEPNFGCCTANFSQGWPKFALSVFMKSEEGLAVTAIAPAKVCTEINGVKVVCEVRTEYPFRDTATITVDAEQPVSFPLDIRLPGFAKAVQVDGKPLKAGQFTRLVREWQEDSVELSMEFEVEVCDRPRDLVCVNRGPLLFSVGIEENWVKHEFERNGVTRQFPYCDYEILPMSTWAYALAGDQFTLANGVMGEYPFAPDTAPVWLTATMCEIPWKKEFGICEESPENRTPLGEPVAVKLLPYGCTNLRLTEFPYLAR